MSNTTVWQTGLALAGIEFQMRRLKRNAELMSGSAKDDVLSKNTDVAAVPPGLPWIQQIYTALLELETFDDFAPIFLLTGVKELLDNREKAYDFVEHDVSVMQKQIWSATISPKAREGSTTVDRDQAVEFQIESVVG